MGIVVFTQWTNGHFSTYKLTRFTIFLLTLNICLSCICSTWLLISLIDFKITKFTFSPTLSSNFLVWTVISFFQHMIMIPSYKQIIRIFFNFMSCKLYVLFNVMLSLENFHTEYSSWSLSLVFPPALPSTSISLFATAILIESIPSLPSCKLFIVCFRIPEITAAIILYVLVISSVRLKSKSTRQINN